MVGWRDGGMVGWWKVGTQHGNRFSHVSIPEQPAADLTTVVSTHLDEQGRPRSTQ